MGGLVDVTAEEFRGQGSGHTGRAREGGAGQEVEPRPPGGCSGRVAGGNQGGKGGCGQADAQQAAKPGLRRGRGSGPGRGS